MSETFRALLLEQADGKTTARVADIPVADLPPGDVLVDVAWSTLNYKDALAITGAGKIVRQFPFVPGHRLRRHGRQLGRCRASRRATRCCSPAGASASAIGAACGAGAGQGRLAAAAARPGCRSRQAMAIGTAGFTAMLAVLALEAQGVTPERGEIVVTGAAGGVGSIAIPLLARRGYQVVASTGRAELERLSAASWVRPRSSTGSSFAERLEGRRSNSARWAGAIDTRRRRHAGQPAQGHAVSRRRGGLRPRRQRRLNGTVFPFILRGVRLIGIDSVTHPADRRPAVWDRLARDLDPAPARAHGDADRR